MKLLCKLRGCDLPPPKTTNVVRQSDRSESGVAWPIECRRCGRVVGPMDPGYPMIPVREP
jgi:hypothetical protein